ncbi:MAG: LacI family DNA-binding transcriptional regulator [Chthoniobacterales bacterium]|nr:LacI family DNA-binding transcriptional regulator [Chthoniobacterales bacterium]
MGQPRVTMQDIARAAGVSKATVSFALRNDARLRPETCRRIRELAEKMGYRPDPVVSQLLAHLRAARVPKFQSTLALLNCSPFADVFDMVRTYGEWREGARAQASELGYGVDEFWIGEENLSPGKLERILHARGIRGVLVAPLFNEGILPSAYASIWNSFACVVLGKPAVNPPMHSACNDQFSTAFQAVLQAARLGCRRPALVLAPGVDRNVGFRFSGGYRAALELCPDMDDAGVFPFDWNERSRFVRWFKRGTPDVLIGAHAEVLDWMQGMGLRVPEDAGLINLDKNSGMSGWAGINQHQPFVGAAGVNLLVGRLHRNETGIPEAPYCAVIPGTWEDGDTMRCLPPPLIRGGRRRPRQKAAAYSGQTVLTR